MLQRPIKMRVTLSPFTITLRRNIFSRTPHAKPLTMFWRSEKTKANPLRNRKPFEQEIEHRNGVRPFKDIPGPNPGLRSMLDFYTKTKGFTKGHEYFKRLFAEYGPIFKKNVMLKTTTVHVIDPDDFERVYRAEGKYPRRPPHFTSIWKDHRERRNYFLGVLLT